MALQPGTVSTSDCDSAGACKPVFYVRGSGNSFTIKSTPRQRRALERRTPDSPRSVNAYLDGVRQRRMEGP